VIEEFVEKVTGQPVVHDPTFVDPADDPAGAAGFLLAVWCDTPPVDGDVAVYVAANSRFELRQPSLLATASPVTIDDGSGGFLLVFDEDGNVVYA
jgi:hypothetical protein